MFLLDCTEALEDRGDCRFLWLNGRVLPFFLGEMAVGRRGVRDDGVTVVSLFGHFPTVAAFESHTVDPSVSPGSPSPFFLRVASSGADVCLMTGGYR